MGEESRTIIAGIILLLLGIAASITISEAMGRPAKDAKKVAKLKAVHRVIALLFAVLMVLISTSMFLRLQFWHGELSARVIVHWGLSLVVILLLVAKIVIYYRYPKMLGHMPVMGWLILLSTFVLFSLTGGLEMLRSGASDKPLAEENYTRALVDRKCGHCHSLERVYGTSWDATQASGIVHWMKDISPGWISDDEAKIITEYLTPRWKLPKDIK